MFKVPFHCDDSGSWKLIAYHPWKWSVPILFLSRISPPCENYAGCFSECRGRVRTFHMGKERNICCKVLEKFICCKVLEKIRRSIVLRKKLAQFPLKFWHLMENSQCLSPVYLVNRITPWWTRKFICAELARLQLAYIYKCQHSLQSLYLQVY